MENIDDQDVELEEQIDEVEEVEEESDETDWKAEALKYKAIAIRNKRKVEEQPPKEDINKLETKAQNPDDELVSRLSNLEMAERKRQFGYEHNLSPAETDRVFQVNNNPSADTLKDPFIKAGLQAIRSQERVDNNTPSSSAKSASLDRRKLSTLSAGDKQAAFEKYMKSKGITE